MPKPKRITFKKNNYVVYVTIDRPEKHNGLDEQLIRELIQAAQWIRKYKKTSVVIVSEAGAGVNLF